MNESLVLEFIKSINAHDVDGITVFLSDDHVFIDAQGNEYKGKERMDESWAEYFVLFPDYNITVEDVLTKENLVAVFGYASGTCRGLTADPANFWRLPAAWKGVIANGKIKLWQVYADYALILDIMARQNKWDDPPRCLTHPETLPVRNPQSFLAVGAKIDVTSAQKCSQLTEGDRSERITAVRADRYDIIFFD